MGCLSNVSQPLRCLGPHCSSFGRNSWWGLHSCFVPCASGFYKIRQQLGLEIDHEPISECLSSFTSTISMTTAALFLAENRHLLFHSSIGLAYWGSVACATLHQGWFCCQSWELTYCPPWYSIQSCFCCGKVPLRPALLRGDWIPIVSSLLLKLVPNPPKTFDH